IVKAIPLPWYSADDLPLNPHLFSYEKDIIEFFKERVRTGTTLFTEPGTDDDDEKKRENVRRKILDGCPKDWPTVVHWTRDGDVSHNRLDEKTVGNFRPEGANVVTGALFTSDSDEPAGDTGRESRLIEPRLCFKEAGPREHLYFPQQGV